MRWLANLLLDALLLSAALIFLSLRWLADVAHGFFNPPSNQEPL